MEELGLPDAVETARAAAAGTHPGDRPTGAGKSTSLASMLDWINTNRACHIITIEDPIEYVHRNKRAAVDQREVGIDTLSFERALRAAFREDPDVLLDRRDARQRDDPRRAHARRNRPPGVRDAAHQRRRADGRPHRRRVPRRAAVADPACSSLARSRRSCRSACIPRRRAGHGRRRSRCSWPPTRCATSSATGAATNCATSSSPAPRTGCRRSRWRLSHLVASGVVCSHEEAVSPHAAPERDPRRE